MSTQSSSSWWDSVLTASPPLLRLSPGQELPLLAAAFPWHRIVGVDLSEGMAALARQLVQQQGLQGQVEVR